jgi:hypothetical protein
MSETPMFRGAEKALYPPPMDPAYVARRILGSVLTGSASSACKFRVVATHAPCRIEWNACSAEVVLRDPILSRLAARGQALHLPPHSCGASVSSREGDQSPWSVERRGAVSSPVPCSACHVQLYTQKRHTRVNNNNIIIMRHYLVAK